MGFPACGSVGWSARGRSSAECWSQHDYLTIGPNKLSDRLARVAVEAAEPRAVLCADSRHPHAQPADRARMDRAVRRPAIWREPQAGAIALVRYDADIPSVDVGRARARQPEHAHRARAPRRPRGLSPDLAWRPRRVPARGTAADRPRAEAAVRLTTCQLTTSEPRTANGQPPTVEPPPAASASRLLTCHPGQRSSRVRSLLLMCCDRFLTRFALCRARAGHAGRRWPRPGPARLRPRRRQRPVERPDAAQNPQVTVALVQDQDARETRENLEEILRKLPPAVGRVLRTDPSLLSNESYLATYPALAAFLKQHPEVRRLRRASSSSGSARSSSDPARVARFAGRSRLARHHAVHCHRRCLSRDREHIDLDHQDHRRIQTVESRLQGPHRSAQQAAR